MSIALRNCRFVVDAPSPSEVRVREGIDIVIENGIITCVGECRDIATGIEEIDCGNYVAIPGLGNAHTHAAMVVLRGYADDYELFDWLPRVWRAERFLTPSIIEHATAIACMEMASCGTTAFQDMYFFPEKVVEIAQSFGLRIRTGPIAGMHRVEDLKHWLSMRSKLFEPVINIHSIYALDLETLETWFGASKDLGIDVHIHLSETRRELYICRKKLGFFPVEFLEKRGWLSERIVGVHLNWVTSWEIEYLAKRRARVVVNPSNGAKLAVGGFTPVKEMISRGIVVGLGTDGACSSNKLSVLNEMRMLVLLYRHSYWDTELRASHALYIATKGSYQAMGFRGGLVEPGYVGDIVLLNLRSLRMYPPTRKRVGSHVVYAAECSDVVYTIVGGRIVWSPNHVERFAKELEWRSRQLESYVALSDGLAEEKELSEEPPWRRGSET